MKPGFAPLLMLTASVPSCADDAPEVRTYRDTGSLCLLPDGRGATLAAISFDPCLSCDDRAIATCSVTISGDRVELSTQLEIGQTPDPPSECPAACSFASATCALNPPTPGDYRIILYGGKSATVTLPVTRALAPYADRDCGG